MKHPIIADLERYNQKNMGILGRILIGIHLKKCRDCSGLLEKLMEDDKLLMEIRAVAMKQPDSDITDSDKTFVSLKKILR